MSFNFGQFRRDQLPVSDYVSSIEYTKQNYQRKTGTTVQKKFVDNMMVISTPMDNTKSYYLQVTINRLPSQQDFSLLLKKSTDDNISQTIDTFSVSSGSSGTETFEFVITPNIDYDQIVFYLTRISTDYQLSNSDNTYGRKSTIEILSFSQINDLLTTPINHTPLIKIGVQGPTGMLMVINGEPIRIGPSGIYEINNGYKIKTFGVIIKDNNLSTDGKEYFILDYQY